MPESSVFYAEFHGPKRGTQAEAEKDWDEIILCLSTHRPDLVPLDFSQKVACKGVNWRDRG